MWNFIHLITSYLIFLSFSVFLNILSSNLPALLWISSRRVFWVSTSSPDAIANLFRLPTAWLISSKLLSISSSISSSLAVASNWYLERSTELDAWGAFLPRAPKPLKAPFLGSIASSTRFLDANTSACAFSLSSRSVSCLSSIFCWISCRLLSVFHVMTGLKIDLLSFLSSFALSSALLECAFARSRCRSVSAIRSNGYY